MLKIYSAGGRVRRLVVPTGLSAPLAHTAISHHGLAVPSDFSHDCVEFEDTCTPVSTKDWLYGFVGRSDVYPLLEKVTRENDDIQSNYDDYTSMYRDVHATVFKKISHVLYAVWDIKRPFGYRKDAVITGIKKIIDRLVKINKFPQGEETRAFKLLEDLIEDIKNLEEDPDSFNQNTNSYTHPEHESQTDDRNDINTRHNDGAYARGVQQNSTNFHYQKSIDYESPNEEDSYDSDSDSDSLPYDEKVKNSMADYKNRGGGYGQNPSGHGYQGATPMSHY